MKIHYFLSHPIQYQTPLIRYLVDGGFDITVHYATDITAKSYLDKGFGQSVAWDLPLMDGYSYTVCSEGAPIPSGMRDIVKYQRFAKQCLRQSQNEIAWIHGWGNGYSLGTLLASIRLRVPVFIRSETHTSCLKGSTFRRTIHRFILSSLFRRVSQFLAVGSANRDFYCRYGVPEHKIHTVPYCVDNEFFQKSVASVDRSEVRRELSIDPNATLVLFCAKLIDVKDPQTLIRAFGKLNDKNSVLLMVGDGNKRQELEELAEMVAPNRVRFLGFQNQSSLPRLYAACDLFVLPSTYEPWGLVINEVMNAAKPVIASDRVGAISDLIVNGLNGDTFPATNVDALAQVLDEWLASKEKRRAGGEASLDIVSRWGFAEAHAGLRTALDAQLTESVARI